MIQIKNCCAAIICGLSELAAAALLVCGILINEMFAAHGDAKKIRSVEREGTYYYDVRESAAFLYWIPAIWILLANIMSFAAAWKDTKCVHGILIATMVTTSVGIVVVIFYHSFVFDVSTGLCIDSEECAVIDDVDSFESNTVLLCNSGCCITEGTEHFCDTTWELIDAGDKLLYINLAVCILTSICACSNCCCQPREPGHQHTDLGGAQVQQEAVLVTVVNTNEFPAAPVQAAVQNNNKDHDNKKDSGISNCANILSTL